MLFSCLHDLEEDVIVGTSHDPSNISHLLDDNEKRFLYVDIAIIFYF